jgi:hypothetical protein
MNSIKIVVISLPWAAVAALKAPSNKGAYALRRIEGDTAHFLMVTVWESEDAIRAFAGDDISWRNTTISTRISCWS